MLQKPRYFICLITTTSTICNVSSQQYIMKAELYSEFVDATLSYVKYSEGKSSFCMGLWKMRMEDMNDALINSFLHRNVLRETSSGCEYGQALMVLQINDA